LHLFRSKKLGAWGIPENVAHLESEFELTGGFRSTANLAEVEKAAFWVRVGGKGPYLTRADAVMEEGASAIMQIVRRRDFELRETRGTGPGFEELEVRSERRLSAMEAAQEKRRLTLGHLVDGVDGAGLRTQPTGEGGLREVTRKTGERAEQGLREGSTHRFDRERVEVAQSGDAKAGGGKEVGKKLVEREREMYLESLAVGVAEGRIAVKDLRVEDYEMVLKMQKTAENGKSRDGREEDSVSVGAVFDERDREEAQRGFVDDSRGRGGESEDEGVEKDGLEGGNFEGGGWGGEEGGRGEKAEEVDGGMGG
jgi:hypothetical protein